MSRILFCSDLHLGHKNIHKFRTLAGNPFIDEPAHREWILSALEKAIKARDRLHIVGDFSFTQEAADEFHKRVPGEKILIRGNHDNLTMDSYMQVFKEVQGLMNYKSFWISHAPIHPAELRGRVNLHGHVHGSTLEDTRYFNLCPENLVPLFGRPWCSLEEIRNLRPRTQVLEIK